MKLTRRSLTVLVLGLALAGPGLSAQPGRQAPPPATEEGKLLEAMHLIQSQPLYNYVQELVSEKYGGRLTGTKEYEACVEWVESLLKGWGVQPGGDNGTYRQLFPNPYTIVFPGGICEMTIPVGKNGVIKKAYQYEDEFMPGGTTGSGQVTAEVVYAGYGVTAPELGYDDYKGVDVKGKIVLLEPEVPVGPGEKTLELFKKWRPYSFHQYKLKNAVAHGAAGLIYNYGPIGNPNNAYAEGFIYHHVGKAVVADVFAGTGRSHEDAVGRIRKELKPQSFATGKTMTISNKSEHHPDGVGINLIGKIEGTDPALKNEVIIIGGHLDHLGRLWKLLPGANDNATAVAVTLGVAEAMAKCAVKPKRTVVFLFFGRSRARTRGPKDRTITPSIRSTRSTRRRSSSTWKAPGRATSSAPRAGRPIPSSGSSSRRPTRATRTGCCPPIRPPIRPGRGRTRLGSSGRACPP
jgi:hypothetical protein